MVVILLAIIACVLLFGADKTKSGMSGILSTLFVVFMIAGLIGSCSN